jgi:hypothetical protein
MYGNVTMKHPAPILNTNKKNFLDALVAGNGSCGQVFS